MAVALPETYGSSQNSGIDFSLCSLRTARKSNRRKIARSLFINYWQCAEQKCLTMRLSWPVLTRAYAVTKLMAEWQPFKFPVKSLSLKLRSSSDPVRRSEAWCRVSGWQLRRGFRTQKKNTSKLQRRLKVRHKVHPHGMKTKMAKRAKTAAQD